MDSRNFVAWHYRRQMVKLAGIDPEEELQYSRDLIDKNFSNYSAWHNRTEVLKSEQLTNQVVSMEDLVAGHSAGRLMTSHSRSQPSALHDTLPSSVHRRLATANSRVACKEFFRILKPTVS